MGDTCIAARFGVRCQDGMIHLQALNRNAGTCFGMSRENTQVKETRGRNTEGQSRGGLLRSSDETPVMGAEQQPPVITKK